jgi:hypothetical protein
MPAASPCVPATDECPLSEAIRETYTHYEFYRP